MAGDYIACGNCEQKFYNFKNQKNCDKCQDALTLLKVAETRKAEATALIEAEKTKSELQLHVDSAIINTLKFKNRRLIMRWVLVWFAIGAGISLYDRHENQSKGCIYRSLASFVNPGYLIGCELFRERFKVGE